VTDLQKIAQLTLELLEAWSTELDTDVENLVYRLFGQLNEAGYLLVHDPDNTNPPSQVWLDELLVDLR
jgi:hypothetical protein